MTKVVIPLANLSRCQPYRPIYCQEVCMATATQVTISCLVVPGARTAPNLLCKRFLRTVELVFPLDTFMSQFVGLALRPLPLVRCRVDALIRGGWLRTIRHIHVLRIRIYHCFSSQPSSMRLQQGPDVRRFEAGCPLRQSIRRRHASVPQARILDRPLLIAVVHIDQPVALRMPIRPFEVVDQAPRME
jgi:hypothetical protein